MATTKVVEQYLRLDLRRGWLELTEYHEDPQEVYRQVVKSVGDTLKDSMGYTKNGNSRFDREAFEKYIFGADL